MTEAAALSIEKVAEFSNPGNQGLGSARAGGNFPISKSLDRQYRRKMRRGIFELWLDIPEFRLNRGYLSLTAGTDNTSRSKSRCELVPVFSIADFKWLRTVDFFKPSALA